MAAATQVMIEAAAHAELRSFEEHRRWKAGCQHDGGRTVKLSERLEAAVERLYEDGMDTRGIADLLRESAELARRVEVAPVAVVECNDAKGALLVTVDDAPIYKGQRVRLVPEAGQGVA